MRAASFVLVVLLVVPVAATSQENAPGAVKRFVIFGSCPGDGSEGVLKTAIVRDFASIDNAPEEKERGITINTSHVEYSTARCADRGDLHAASAAGDIHPDTGILVVSSPDLTGVADQIRHARLMGLSRLIVWVDAQLDDASYKKLEAINKGGSQRQSTTVIRGSALRAIDGDPDAQKAISALIAATHLTAPPREKDKPFLMRVEDVDHSRAEPVATGYIGAGSVQVGDTVELIGLGEPPQRTTITGIEMFRKLLDRAEAGDNVGLLLRGIDKKDIRRGMVIAAQGSASAAKSFKAEVYILKKEEGGRHTPFHNKVLPLTVMIGTAEVEGNVDFATRTPASPGDTVTITVKLIVPVAMDKGLRMVIREGGHTVGAGQVTEIIK